jgi:hypothetical protein
MLYSSRQTLSPSLVIAAAASSQASRPRAWNDRTLARHMRSRARSPGTVTDSSALAIWGRYGSQACSTNASRSKSSSTLLCIDHRKANPEHMTVLSFANLVATSLDEGGPPSSKRSASAALDHASGGQSGSSLSSREPLRQLEVRRRRDLLARVAARRGTLFKDFGSGLVSRASAKAVLIAASNLSDWATGGTKTPTIESQMASGSVSLTTLTSDGSPLRA